MEVWCPPEQQVSYRRKASFFWKVTPPPGDARPDRNPGANGIGRLLKGCEFFPGKKGKFRKVVNHFALRPGKGWPGRNPALRGNSFGVGHGPDTKTPDGVFDPLPGHRPDLPREAPWNPDILTYQNEERMVSTMKNKTATRRRNKSVTFRMNERRSEKRMRYSHKKTSERGLG